MICPMEKFALEFLDNEEKRARYSLKWTALEINYNETGFFFFIEHSCAFWRFVGNIISK